MYTFNTILFSIVFAALTCTANVSSVYAQGYDDPASPDYQYRSPFNSPLYNNSQPYSGYDSRPGEIYGGLNNRQDPNQWTSGQPHKPSDQWTPAPPVTQDISVWQGGKLQGLCTRSGNTVSCLP